jgi:hypothetical protein
MKHEENPKVLPSNLGQCNSKYFFPSYKKTKKGRKRKRNRSLRNLFSLLASINAVI